jgi:hypothetical protein
MDEQTAKALVLKSALIISLCCSTTTALAMPLINYQFPSETLTPEIRSTSIKASVSLSKAISMIFLAMGELEHDRVQDANMLIDDAEKELRVAIRSYKRIKEIISARPRRAKRKIRYELFFPEIRDRIDLIRKIYSLPLPYSLESLADLALLELEQFRREVNVAKFRRENPREKWFKLFEGIKRVVDIGGMVSDISSRGWSTGYW